MRQVHFRMQAFLLMLVMLCALAPLALAQSTSNLTPTLNVRDSSGNKPAFVGNQWNLTDGTYTVSGTAQNYEGLKISGNVTLNLVSATIEHKPSRSDLTNLDIQNQFIPAISIESGSVELNLVGESTVKGSPGYAGIYVSTDATLTISGKGKLTATGGRYSLLSVQAGLADDNNMEICCRRGRHRRQRVLPIRRRQKYHLCATLFWRDQH